MLVAIIILSVIVATAIVIFAVGAVKIYKDVEEFEAKYTLLHDKYCAHEDRITCNYKSIAELNRRQDEWQKKHRTNDENIVNAIGQLGVDVAHLQEYNKKREAEEAEVVAEIEEALKVNGCAKIVPPDFFKSAKIAAEKATKKAKPAADRPATDLRPTPETANANRHRFAELRKTMSMHEAQVALGISRTTARRYEQWRKDNKQ